MNLLLTTMLKNLVAMISLIIQFVFIYFFIYKYEKLNLFLALLKLKKNVLICSSDAI
jgi:hypothetical protein